VVCQAGEYNLRWKRHGLLRLADHDAGQAKPRPGSLQKASIQQLAFQSQLEWTPRQGGRVSKKRQNGSRLS
jgi:hypothetical protein